MDIIPLINPKLIKVVAAQADRASMPILRAEVVSSEPINSNTPQEKNAAADPKSTSRSTESKGSTENKGTTEHKTSSENRTTTENKSASDNESAKKDQQYRVVLKIGKYELETISTEKFSKGSQLDVKVTPGPELKIIAATQDGASDSAKSGSSNTATNNVQVAAQAAMQQLLADRIPNIQPQGLTKLIDQLSQLITGSKAPIEPELPLKLGIDKSVTTETRLNTQTAKQILANLAYQALAKNLESSPKTAINSSTSINTATTNLTEAKPTQTSEPLQQVKNWLQQLPSSSDISNSTGLRNALNNTGVRAETQLSELAQQFISLNKNQPKANSEQSANSIFQQLQKIQQKVFSTSPESTAKADLGSIVKNTAQTLENNSQKILSNLKNSLFKNKSEPSVALTAHKADQPLAKPNPLNPIPTTLAAQKSAALSSTTASLTTTNPATLSSTASNWQNPLLNSQAYSTINELLKDPLLQNPSSNNKFALSQILNQLGDSNSQVRIPLNWPERSGNDAVILRTLQNMLGHIEREQSVQLQQTDGNISNNPNLLNSQNQQWLPLLIHHQQQLQLIEFFIDKEEKKNAQGEKKNHWLINLHFDLPVLGELGIEISMFENECKTTFWSESSSTLGQLSHHVQPLRQRLTEQGIIVSDVQSRHGTLAKRKQNIQQRLVDIKT